MNRRTRTFLSTAGITATLLLPTTADAISGGTSVPEGEAPWLAVFRSGPSTVCGGALIAADRVVTAAHCVQGAAPSSLELLLGDAPLSSGRLRAVGWTGAQMLAGYRDLPSSYRPGDPRYAATVDDLAVVRLAAPVRDVVPLRLLRSAPGPLEQVGVFGRGRTGAADVADSAAAPDPGAPSDDARRITQAIVGGAACRDVYRALLRPDRHLCSVDPTPTAGQACAGDSGGPLVVWRAGAARLVGVVTWGGETRGRDCGEGLPDVAERVDAHRDLLRASEKATDRAPWATTPPRVHRRNGRLTCLVGRWSPAGARLRVTWFRPGVEHVEQLPGGVHRIWRGPDRPVRGLGGRTVAVRAKPLGCLVRATTAGGWATERAVEPERATRR